MEAYTYWDRHAPWNILTKSSLLSERARLPTRTLVFILRPRGYRSQRGRFRLTVGGQLTQEVRFKAIPMWMQQPQSWWEEAPGLMALYPLCRHQRPAHDALNHAAGVIANRVTDSIERANLLTSLAVFGKLVYPQIDVFALIGREQMRESRFLEEVMQEGRLEGQRKAILEALEIRFGPEAAAPFKSPLDALRDSDQLTQLLRLAIRCPRIKQFRDAFPGN
jgi:hypothetical protein